MSAADRYCDCECGCAAVVDDRGPCGPCADQECPLWDTEVNPDDR